MSPPNSLPNTLVLPLTSFFPAAPLIVGVGVGAIDVVPVEGVRAGEAPREGDREDVTEEEMTGVPARESPGVATVDEASLGPRRWSVARVAGGRMGVRTVGSRAPAWAAEAEAEREWELRPAPVGGKLESIEDSGVRVRVEREGPSERAVAVESVVEGEGRGKGVGRSGDDMMSGVVLRSGVGGGGGSRELSRSRLCTTC